VLKYEFQNERKNIDTQKIVCTSKILTVQAIYKYEYSYWRIY